MPLSYGFASYTCHNISKPARARREVFRLTPLATPGAAHGSSTYPENKSSEKSTSSSSWKSRYLCAMTSPSDASFRTGPLSPPTPSSINAHPTKRTINPGVYICKGEGHSVRHSWIVGGRLVDFPFPETRSLHDGNPDEQQRKHQMDEGTRPPVSVPGAGSRRRPSEASNTSLSSSSGRSY